MKKNKKILLSIIALSNFAAADLLLISSCSNSPKSDQHTSCSKKEKSSVENITYFIDLDSENYKIDDFNINLSNGNLSIVKKEIISKQLKIVVTDSKTNNEQTYNFDLKLRHKNWENEETINGFVFNKKIIDREIKNHDDNSWLHAIQHMSSCKHPTIFLVSDASFAMQQIANLYISSSLLAIQNGNTYTNPEYKFNDFVYLTLGNAWDNKQKKIISENYALCCNYLTDSNFGFTDILKNAELEHKFDLAKGNNLVISNLQDFNLELSSYDKTAGDYLEWNNHWSPKIINKIMDLYEAIQPDIKFNFVGADVIWDIWTHNYEEHEFDEEQAKTIIRIMKKLDKFYIVSDGSYTWNIRDKIFKDKFVKDGYIPASKQADIFKKLTTLPENEAIDLLKNTNLMDLANNEEYFINFTMSKNATKAPCMLDKDCGLNVDSRLKSENPWISMISYKNILDSDKYQKYKKCYTSLYHFYDEGKQQKFKDFVLYDTYVNYDFDKKNLIFVCPGAFRDGKIPEEIANEFWAAIREIFDKIKENYPVDEWNYIFKFHPRTTESAIINTLLKLFNVSSIAELPKNIIILNQTYPIEYLVCLDLYLKEENIEEHYHLIDPTSLANDKPSGVLTGFDLDSTTFYSLTAMFKYSYGYEWKDAKKIMQKDAFFIPNKFEISSYNMELGKSYKQQNLNSLVSYYKSLYQNEEFIDPNTFEVVE